MVVFTLQLSGVQQQLDEELTSRQQLQQQLSAAQQAAKMSAKLERARITADKDSHTSQVSGSRYVGQLS